MILKRTGCQKDGAACGTYPEVKHPNMVMDSGGNTADQHKEES